MSVPPALHDGPGPVRRVVLTGGESTGKTTLAAWLAGVYGTTWAPEYARQHLEAKGAPLTASDIDPIARGQMAGEDAAAREAVRVVFCDTDLVSTVVYARHYYGSCPPWVEEAATARRAALYLLLHPDVPWVADQQRDRPHDRHAMHALFRAALDELGAVYVDVAGPWDERRTRARHAVDAILA